MQHSLYFCETYFCSEFQQRMWHLLCCLIIVSKSNLSNGLFMVRVDNVHIYNVGPFPVLLLAYYG